MWEVECPCGKKPGLELLRAGHLQMCRRTHADVQQDPADEDTSETSYVDVGMGKNPTLSPWGGCEGTWCPT